MEVGGTLCDRTEVGVTLTLTLATRENVDELLLLPPTRLEVGSVEVEEVREGEPLPLLLPLGVLRYTLAVGGALYEREEVPLES